jgi:hypothetical protein
MIFSIAKTLGKAMGVDSKAGQRGFATGVFKRASQTIDEDAEERQEQINRIAEFKIERDQREQERYLKEYRENKEKIKGIAGKVGGVDGAEWLVRTYGIEEAVKKADQLEVLQGMGSDISFLTKDENKTTLDDLTAFVTSAPEIAKIGPVRDTGILARFGLAPDIAEEAQKRADAAVSDMGYGRVRDVSLGDMPEASGFDTSDLGMMADFKDEARRQIVLAQRAKEAGDMEGYKRHRSRANEMISFNRMMDVKQVTESGSRSNFRLLSGQIGQAAGFKTEFYTDANGQTSHKTSYQETTDNAKAMQAAGFVNELYTQAVNAGVAPGTALRVVNEAIAQNRMPVFTPAGETGAPTFAIGTTRLVEGGFVGGKGAYAPQTETPVVDDPVTDTDTNTASPSLQSLINQHNSASSQADRSAILAEIAAAEGVASVDDISPQTRAKLN